MYSEYFVISGGNKTCLIWDCVKDKESVCVENCLNQFEQIGFVSHGTIPTLTMMGNELCVNGILALATRMSAEKGMLYASGIEKEIAYEHTHRGTKISFTLPYTIENNVVLFEGIGFLCIQKKKQSTKDAFRKLTQKYSLPAFGIISYEENKIDPWVYVQKTDSLVHETACGSGSIAVHLLTGFSDIIQPTGKTISVTHERDMFSVTAEVQLIEHTI